MKISCHFRDIPRLLSENIVRNNIVHCPCFDAYSSLLLRCSLLQIKAVREIVNSNEELEQSLVLTFKRNQRIMSRIKNAIVRENRYPQVTVEDFMFDDCFWQTFLPTASLNGALRTFD